MSTDLRPIAAAVEGVRVLERLDELATFGEQADGGVTRVAFSPDEIAARDRVADWMREAGLDVRFDRFGNMFGSTDANKPGARVSMSGSHIDSVPSGGRLDGTLGVVGAIEAVEAMRRAECLPERPLEVVVWRCEEPVRFSQGKAGSLFFSGSLSLEDLRALEDPPIDLAEIVAQEAARPQRDETRVVASVLELHIEQGCVLERRGRQLGVVTAIAAPIRMRMRFVGRADHSGTTPMLERRDALCGAAEIVLAVEAAALEERAAASVATTSAVDCVPGAMNVVPGAVTLLVDVRGVDEASIGRLRDTIRARAETIAAARRLDLDFETLSVGTPTPLRPDVVEHVADALRDVGYDPMLMPSGAGHDAQCFAPSADVGMIFVPSVGGISHSPDEHTAPEDTVAGARALAAAWFAMASR
jgi:hydantoinase/carbamoylase family amidase